MAIYRFWSLTWGHFQKPDWHSGNPWALVLDVFTMNHFLSASQLTHQQTVPWPIHKRLCAAMVFIVTVLGFYSLPPVSSRLKHSLTLLAAPFQTSLYRKPGSFWRHRLATILSAKKGFLKRCQSRTDFLPVNIWHEADFFLLVIILEHAISVNWLNP